MHPEFFGTMVPKLRTTALPCLISVSYKRFVVIISFLRHFLLDCANAFDCNFSQAFFLLY